MAKRKNINQLGIDPIDARNYIDKIKASSDAGFMSKIDYLATQINQPSMVFKEIIKDGIDKSIISDRHEDMVYGLWYDNQSELTEIFTSSLQSSQQTIYYRNVYESNDTSIGPEFSISYADYYGYGSSTGSFGTIPTNVYESKALYSKYRNLLLGTDEGLFEFKRPSWHNESDIYSRVYLTGYSTSNPTNYGGNTPITTNFVRNMDLAFTTKLPVSDWKQVTFLNSSLIMLKSDGTLWGLGFNSTSSLGINPTGSFYNYPVLVQTGSDWSYIDAGRDHCMAIKTDGTLWGWGNNSIFQLGDESNSTRSAAVQIGGYGSKWKTVSAGAHYSMGIKEEGTLWAWGANYSRQFGSASYSSGSFSSPVQIGSLTNWKDVYCSKTDRTNEMTTLMLKENNELSGSGANGNYQLGTGTSTTSITEPRGIMSDVSDMAMSRNYAAAIKTDGTIWRWGDPAWDTAVTTPTQFTNLGSNWQYVWASDEHFVASKTDKTIYTWGYGIGGGLGSNELVVETTPITPVFSSYFEEDKYGLNLEIISAAAHGAYAWQNRMTAVVSQYDIDINYYEESDFIYIINTNRDRFKDKIKPGSWQLSLTSVDFDGTLLSGSQSQYPNVLNLIDDSSTIVGSINDDRDVYNIYSGSLENSFYTGSFSVPYGLFYPKHGIMVLNGRSLYSFISLFTNRSIVTGSGAFFKSSNADTLYTSISGAIQINSSSFAFKANSAERVESSFIFVRIKSNEFNYTNNPSYADIDNGVIKPKVKNDNFGLTYITTIGLYDDEENLLAVAKFSRPIKKTIEKDMVVKIRIRY